MCYKARLDPEPVPINPVLAHFVINNAFGGPKQPRGFRAVSPRGFQSVENDVLFVCGNGVSECERCDGA